MFRAWFLRRHPVCVDCEERGIVRPATDVHHVQKVADYPELELVESNCMALCHEDHSIRTARGE
jgi:5-methylcytosine-specific restriction protein A